MPLQSIRSQGSCAFATAVVAFALQVSSPVVAQTSGVHSSPAAQPLTTRMVVKFKPSSLPSVAGIASANARTAGAAKAQALSLKAGTMVSSLSHAAGKKMSVARVMGHGTSVVYQLERPMTLLEAHALALRIRALPGVERAEPDLPVSALPMPRKLTPSSTSKSMRVGPQSLTLTPDDPYSRLQWSHFGSDIQIPGGAGLWSASAAVNTGNRVAVAVIDSGHVPHSDLDANVVPGHDFIDRTDVSNDGDGRDSDPSDPGDNCGSGTSSSWHGLSVASIVAAQTGNGRGISGAADKVAQVMPLRALGCGGGYMSDILDAMVWAAGVDVAGVPTNPTPARVVNLSLGASPAACPPYVQDAVDLVASHNAIVVASTGNDGSSSGVSALASCDGVLGVGAHNKDGDATNYSNMGSHLALTAPAGGDCRTLAACDTTPVLALSNNGYEQPGMELHATEFAGTSAAAPMVSGAAALVMAAKPELTPAQVASLLKATANPHPAGTYCADPLNKPNCGAGMLSADNAIFSMTGALVTVDGPTKSVEGGTLVTLTAAGAGLKPFSYAWSQVSGPAVTLRNATSTQVSFTAPRLRTDGPVTIRVSMTDANGSTTSATHTVEVNNMPAPDVPPSGHSVAAGATFTYELPATDVDGDTLAWAVVSASSVPSDLIWPARPTIVNGNVLSWTPPAEGSASLQLQATDGEESSLAKDFFITVTAAGTTPVDSGGGSGGSGSPGGTDSASSGGSAGGGSSSPIFLLGLLGAIVALRRAR